MNNETRAGTKTIQVEKKKLSEEIGGIVDDATELLNNLSTTNLDDVKGSLARAQTAVTNGAKQYAGATDTFVRANPWIALGAALGAGLLIGVVLARR